MTNKKFFIIAASVVIPIIIFGIFTFSNIQKEKTEELPEPSKLVVGELWVINYEYLPESFPIDSINKELRIIYGFRDVHPDPILDFDTMDKILEHHSYLEYDYPITENTFGLLLYGDSDSQERILSKKLFEEIPGVTNAQFHDVWSVKLIL